MSKSLADVHTFGAIDADADELLEPCFQDHEAYQDAQAHKSFLVLGRKGSGKTAIYSRLIRTTGFDHFALGHTFADYPWHHHRLQKTVGVPEEMRYIQSWQYLILLAWAKVLINRDQSQPWSEASRRELPKLESFVVDSYGSRDPEVTTLFSPGRRLKIRPHLSLPNLGEAGVDLESLPINELPAVVQEVNATILDALVTCLNPRHNYYLCFDELDRHFDPDEDVYPNMLTGLILAARRINRECRKRGKKASVLIFLRDDIYQILRFEDKNKITENSSVLIEWDSPRSRWTLQELMERRFGEVLLERDHLDWNEVFDETKEMPGRQSKYQHILDRTFRRPRDIIKFCNEILAAHHQRDKEDGWLRNEDVNAARPHYSAYLLQELDDEVHKHVPHYQNHLDLLRTVGTLPFNIEDFREASAARPKLLTEEEAPIDALRSLFEFSVIGYQRSGGAGGGSSYIWSYQDPRARFDEQATQFRVHLGLLEALDLKKYRKK